MLQVRILHKTGGKLLLSQLWSQWFTDTYMCPSWWRHNGHDGISNHQPHHCLLNCLIRCRSKKTPRPHVTGFCVGHSPWIGEFPTQMASNAENVSIWWRHHVSGPLWVNPLLCCIYFTKCRSIYLLSHPVLGWLYVFSLFPPGPRPPPPPPPPQKLFPLTSKPFELNLWYLAQRIYGSGEMYWMTFPWPWPKVTAVASISKNLLLCAIKWEPLIGSLQNVAALLP